MDNFAQKSIEGTIIRMLIPVEVEPIIKRDAWNSGQKLIWNPMWTILRREIHFSILNYVKNKNN